MQDLETRLRTVEDRVGISETVIRHCLSVDRRDWKMFARCFTDPVLTGYQEGTPTGTMPRDELVGIVSEAARRLHEHAASQHQPRDRA